MGPQPWRTECPPCGPDEFCDKQGFPECLKCDDGPCDPYRFNKELCKKICPDWTASSVAPSGETPLPHVSNMWISVLCLVGVALLLVLLLLIWLFIKTRLRRKCASAQDDIQTTTVLSEEEHDGDNTDIEITTVPSEEKRNGDNVTACYIPTDETALHTAVGKDTQPDESTTLLENRESGAKTSIEGRTADGPRDACAPTMGAQSKPDIPSMRLLIETGTGSLSSTS